MSENLYKIFMAIHMREDKIEKSSGELKKSVKEIRRKKDSKMAKFQSLAVAAALCFLSTLSFTVADQFIVEGKVYCDTCRLGFETFATYYIREAKVSLECKNRSTHMVTFNGEGTTDAHGTYQILEVTGDHADDICEVALLSSPVEGCNEPMKGRAKARILLTKDNGIISSVRYANPLGFYKKNPLPICPKIVQQYNILS
ncbi:hypothetical protein H6P81_011463 [Aristolochia fimbriata]|uniref:Uncharacterized protein n=1 Tax=Aristolochia fimbriata TaxID=158543 RepID=A0AAV7ES12_ARIFI|nr:hypothetical protein H6P81_011463 [Aristolochia fimbriata]